MIRCRVTKNNLKLLNSNDIICMTIHSLECLLLTLETRYSNDISMVTRLH